MESWRDQGIVLSVRQHGENGGVVSILTETQGRHAGFVRGIHSAKMRGLLQRGNLVDVEWSARNHDELGAFRLEQDRHITAGLMGDKLRLSALLSACGLCDRALPEREGYAGLFHGFVALLDAMDIEGWGAVYVIWEIALLRELGFALDLSCCAVCGDAENLAYVSPKSGRAVSEAAAAPYKERLLALPSFLKPGQSDASDEEVAKGLSLTGYFLKNWVFAQHTQGIPEDRLRFEERFVTTVSQDEKAIDGDEPDEAASSDWNYEDELESELIEIDG